MNIATTIKPLHSIVSNITGDLYAPILLVDKQTSAHHYQLKPQDRLTIAKADQLFWFGPSIETAFHTSLKNNTKAVNLLQLKNLTNYALRETHSNHEHKHHTEDSEIDPHIWLSTQNAIIIAKAIAARLSELDKGNAEQYQKNTATFITKVNTLQGYLQQKFAGTQNKPFASLHDAFQYIEKEFNLRHVANLSLHPNLPLSGKQRLHINQTITQNDIQCIFYDPAHHPKAAQQLASQQQITLQALDPIGYQLEKGQSLYFDLLKNLAKEITSCLNQAKRISSPRH